MNNNMILGCPEPAVYSKPISSFLSSGQGQPVVYIRVYKRAKKAPKKSLLRSLSPPDQRVIKPLDSETVSLNNITAGEAIYYACLQAMVFTLRNLRQTVLKESRLTPHSLFSPECASFLKCLALVMDRQQSYGGKQVSFHKTIEESQGQ